MKTNKRIAMPLALVLIASVFASAFVLGYDASSPYTVTLNWIVPTDTTFTVALAGAESTIDFNPTNKSSLEVMPDSQSDVTPIVTVTNQGNVIANYSMVIAGVEPSWVTLKGLDSYVYGSAVTIDDTTAVTLKDNVAVNNSAELWLWSDFANASAGTNSTTFQISAVAS